MKFRTNLSLKSQNQTSNSLIDDFEYDSKEKIDKKFDYFCRNYTSQWLNCENTEEDLKTPKNAINFDTTPAKAPYFRSVIRKKAMLPEAKSIPFANYSAKKAPNSRNPLHNLSFVRKKSKHLAHEKTKEVKFDSQISLFEGESTPHIHKKLESTLKEIYSHYSKGNSRKHLIEFFGNAVIAAFIESLINVSLEEIHSMTEKQQNNINLEPWVARSFGISWQSLQKMNSLEEKQNYIISCMQKTIEGLYEKWKQKHLHREKINEMLNERIDKNFNASNKNDQFSWLKIKTRFEFLKKNLRLLIIEKMNHYENQEKILKALQQRRDSRSSPKTCQKKYSMKSPDFKISPSFSQIFLDRVPALSTSRVLQNMNRDSKVMAEKFWTTANDYFDTGSLSQKYKQNSKGYMSKTGYLRSTTPDSEENRTVFFYPTSHEEKNAISEELKEIFNWNEKREADFQRTRAEVKTKHANEINVSNWYELASLPMVQEIHLDFKRLKQRDLKLQKFAEGNYLSPEDLKFLVDTSDLLNSCVDKQFLQDAVNIIDEEVFKNLELYLAENILMNYEEIKSVIKESRLRYLEQKNREFVKKEQKFQENKERKNKIEQNKLQSSKTIKMFRTICEKIKNNKKNAENENKKSLRMENDVKKYLTEESKEVKKRNLHPPSKIMSVHYYQKNDVYDPERVEKIAKFNQEIAHNYKLNLHSPSIMKKSENFVKFYSGGPVQPNLPEKEIKQIVFSQSDLAKIIRIQCLIRRQMSRKHFLKMKAQKDLAQRMKKSINDLDFPYGRVSLKKTESQKEAKFNTKNEKSVNPSTMVQETSALLTPCKMHESQGLGTLNLSTCQSSKSTFLLPTSERKKTDEFLKEPAKPTRKKNVVRVRKLFEAAKKNRFIFVTSSGQIYDKNDVNERDSQGNVPLYYTARYGNLEFCEFLIGYGAKVNEVCSNGDTPVHMACQSNNFDVIILMISNKGSMNAVNKDGLTPLAFLNEGNLARLNLMDGIASISEKHHKTANFNNDSKFHQKYIKKEVANEYLIHSFQPTFHHINDKDYTENKVSSFQYEKEAKEDNNSNEFMGKLNKIIIRKEEKQ